MTTACSASTAALSRSPEPIARATDDDTPLPMAPLLIIPISMTKGNTSAMAASGTVPRLPT